MTVRDEWTNDGDFLAGWAPVCGNPIGTVTAEALLFEEEGEDGPIFILQLADFLGALDSSPAHTLACMQAVCDTVFHEHLASEGTYSLHGVAFYVFRFRDLDLQEARRQARRVVDEVGRRLLGDRFHPFATGQDVAAAGAEATALDANRDAAAGSEAMAEWNVRMSPSGVAEGFAGDAPGIVEDSAARRYRPARTYAHEDIGKKGDASGTGVPARTKRAISN